MSGLDSIGFKACGKSDFQHWAVAPVLGNGWALLGEQSKWVPVSAARFSELSWSETAGASVVATGDEGEEITVAWAKPGSSAEPVVVKCIIPRGSKALIGTDGSCTQV